VLDYTGARGTQVISKMVRERLAGAWFENPPHPAAAQLFVTWYLSREFQQAYANATRGNSRRTTVLPGDPDPNHVMHVDVQYRSVGDEAATVEIEAFQKEIKNWDVLR
jgi:ABC-type Fe3+ transport system substrate-binding protein